MPSKATPKTKTPEPEIEVTKDVAQGLTQKAAALAIGGYFTKELHQQMSEMTDDVMITLLRELEQSQFFPAILKYVNARLLMAQSTINALDPNTQATAIARTQGIMQGIVDIQNVVISLVATETQMAEEAEEIRHLA